MDAQIEADLFARHPHGAGRYAGRLLCRALCQGAALHYLDGKNGVKDFDVWSFYAALGESPGLIWGIRLKSSAAVWGEVGLMADGGPGCCLRHALRGDGQRADEDLQVTGVLLSTVAALRPERDLRRRMAAAAGLLQRLSPGPGRWTLARVGSRLL